MWAESEGSTHLRGSSGEASLGDGTAHAKQRDITEHCAHILEAACVVWLGIKHQGAVSAWASRQGEGPGCEGFCVHTQELVFSLEAWESWRKRQHWGEVPGRDPLRAGKFPMCSLEHREAGCLCLLLRRGLWVQD